MYTCLNCNNGFEGKFCNICGQKASVARFDTTHLAHELTHTFLHLDHGIFKNIRSIVHPRKTVLEFIAGKRAGYFSPGFFFLLSLGLIFFLEAILHQSVSFDFTIDLGREYTANNQLVKNIKYIYFGSVFIQSMITHPFFKKETGYNYVENVVANIFIQGYVNMVYLLLIFLPSAGNFPVTPYVIFLQFIFTAVVFYRGKWLPALLKSIGCIMLQWVLFILTLFVLTVVIGALK